MNEPNGCQYRDAHAHVPCAVRSMSRFVGERFGAGINKHSWDADVGAWIIREYRQRPLLAEDMCDPAAPREELAVEIRVYPRSAKDAQAVWEAINGKAGEAARQAGKS